ncbi:hypothetical protein MRB53_022160 [Persea americana]|uniref:Uncharacterized protein n=1 Tax=Persea americana TaxID=3435 RepID=A0ACC2L660_PERAE|nr:hypothetical protein MRB53_022160 [Persea americana]|eukprot:TRINITY_DN36422_c0_g1_i1.p1 TRINITY_DN36422_c0_g1~~TRINITY_DN36422_c0_g1_i1.p1  ORF type:complete len:1056 (-),score=209.06 TRINITY_DN36422_c0_g1_i1:219-3386(-)
MKVPTYAPAADPSGGNMKSINPELWHACAGPLVSLPAVGTYVVYFPQGHCDQVAASMQKDANIHIPNYPNLPSKLICLLHNIRLHADAETDEVYAQMTLQPVNTFDKEILMASELALKSIKPQMEFFCKTLTPSDTSTHGGFSVPRRAAEKIFPPLDFSMQPPSQELVAKDLHDNSWTFRHIFRGQPKRHLLTTGWSLFVSGKRLFAGDSVLFIRDEKSQLLLGVRRAKKQSMNISSSVLSSDSMLIGILAAAAHAATNHSPFTVYYNPRASPSEFVIPLAKYNKAVYRNQISLGMRFRMMFETEELGTRRYMGTITGISDLDPVRWKNSQWRNLQVGWDEAAAGERLNRVSIWEIEPVAAPFFICPPPFFRSRFPRQPGLSDEESSDMENLFRRTVPWFAEEIGTNSQNAVFPGLSLVEWMNMQQNPPITNSTMQSDYLCSLPGSVLQNLTTADMARQLGLQAQIIQQNNPQFNAPRPPQQVQQLNIPKLSVVVDHFGSVDRLQQQELDDINQLQRHHLTNQTLTQNQNHSNLLQPPILVQTQVQQQQLIQNDQPLVKLSENQQQQQPEQRHIGRTQQSNQMSDQLSHPGNQQVQLSEHQIKLQLLQKLQQEQQPFLSQPTLQQPQLTHLQKQQRQPLEIPHLPQNPSLPSQQQAIQQHSVKKSEGNVSYSQSMQHQQALLPEFPMLPPPPSAGLLSPPAGFLLAAGGSHSRITNDAPSCSTSPSTNNCSIHPQSILNRTAQGTVTTDGMAQSTEPIVSPGALEVMTTSLNLAKAVQKTDMPMKPSMPVSTSQVQGTHQVCSSALQMYLDTPSSGTSACFSHTDTQLQQSPPSASLNPSAMLLRDAVHSDDVHANPRNNVLFGAPSTPEYLLARNIGSEKDLQSESMLTNFGNSKEVPHEPSSTVSQSFGVLDMEFNNEVSVDPDINYSGFMKGGSWAPPPQLQPMRTFTKVHKRGAVGRSVDIARYSGYNELKQDLAHRFGIEGQLEDGQKIGWKLVYVDHENDVLLLGDDPWEEFVNCVRCIKILSPQEVQQMSLDGDFENALLQNQGSSRL